MLIIEKERHLKEYNSAFFNQLAYKQDAIEFSFWKMQKENHQIDAMKIQQCIDYLKRKFDINGF